MNIFKTKNDVIPYTINKAFAGSLCISVEGNEVVVNAPWYVSRKYIQDVINEKKQWIISKIKEYNKPQVLDKGNINLLGNIYNIYLVYNNTKNPVINLEDNYINIVLPNKYKKIDVSYIIELLVDKLYYRVTNEYIEKAMEKTRLLLGIAPDDYSVDVLENNVLSKYSDKTQSIVFNSKICTYSKEIIDYIVLHEFCHLKYKSHCKSFWKMVEKYCPNYKKYENILQIKKY